MSSPDRRGAEGGPPPPEASGDFTIEMKVSDVEALFDDNVALRGEIARLLDANVREAQDACRWRQRCVSTQAALEAAEADNHCLRSDNVSLQAAVEELGAATPPPRRSPTWKVLVRLAFAVSVVLLLCLHLATKLKPDLLGG